MAWRDSLSLIQIHSALLVHRHGSIQSAADQLNLSASQVSRNVASVERGMGAALFLRRGPQLMLTPYGREILPRLEQWFEDLQTISHYGKAVHEGRAGLLRLAYTRLTAFTALPLLLPRLRASQPDIQLELLPMPDPACAEAVASGTVDAALLSPPISRVDLIVTPISYDPLALAVPEGWEVKDGLRLDDARLDRVFVAPFAEWPWTLQQVLSLCAEQGFRPNFEQTVNDAIGRMVLALAHDAGALVSMVRSRIQLPGVKVVPVMGLGELGYQSALVTQSDPSPVARRLQQLAAACAES